MCGEFFKNAIFVTKQKQDLSVWEILSALGEKIETLMKYEQDGRYLAARHVEKKKSCLQSKNLKSIIMVLIIS